MIVAWLPVQVESPLTPDQSLQAGIAQYEGDVVGNALRDDLCDAGGAPLVPPVRSELRRDDDDRGGGTDHGGGGGDFDRRHGRPWVDAGQWHGIR